MSLKRKSDKSELPSVAKFPYPKELLAPNFRLFTEDLPYNSEGYDRAKTISKSTFGKPSELAMSTFRIFFF